MDTRARVEAVREKLNRLHADEISANSAGPACPECLHCSYVEEDKQYGIKQRGPFCRHIVYSERRFDPSLSKWKERTDFPAAKARAEGGLCGPEALLFESKPLHIRALIKFNRSPVAFPTYMIGGGIGVTWLLSLFGLS